MAWVTNEWRSGIGRTLKVKPHQTDLNIFRVIKVKQNYNCSICCKKILKGTYSYGSDWTRLCLECGHEFSKKALPVFESVISYIKRNINKHKQHINKWNEENLIASL